MIVWCPRYIEALDGELHLVAIFDDKTRPTIAVS